MKMKRNKQVDVFLGKKLKTIRKKHKITQAKLGELTSMSHQQIQQYEIGESRIPANFLFDLSQIFNVSPSYFYEGLDSKMPVKNSIANDNKLCVGRYRPLKVMIVEDNPAEEILLREALSGSEQDMTIVSFQDGESAIEFLKTCSDSYHDNKRPDIIFLDLNLPKRNGHEVLKFIKKNEKLRDIQTMVLTNSINPSDMYDTYKMFSSGYIKKSHDLEVFTEQVCKIINYWNLVVTPSMQYE
jgi:two-component system response regulator